MVLGAPPPDGMAFLTYPAATTVPPPQPGTLAFAPNSLSTFANPVWQPFVGTANDTPPYSTGVDGTGTDYHVLGPDIFRLEYCFLLKPYKTSTGTVLSATYSDTPYDTRAAPGPAYTSPYGLGMQDVQAIVVAVAILDAKSRAIVVPTDLQTLAGKLGDSNFSGATLATSAPALMAQTWEGQINPASFSGILKTAVQNVRIYQRTFYLCPFLGNP